MCNEISDLYKTWFYGWLRFFGIRGALRFRGILSDAKLFDVKCAGKIHHLESDVLFFLHLILSFLSQQDRTFLQSATWYRTVSERRPTSSSVLYTYNFREEHVPHSRVIGEFGDVKSFTEDPRRNSLMRRTELIRLFDFDRVNNFTEKTDAACKADREWGREGEGEGGRIRAYKRNDKSRTIHPLNKSRLLFVFYY